MSDSKKKFDVKTLLRAMKRFEESWNCPAGNAYRKWAKEIIDAGYHKISADDVIFLRKVYIGSINFNEDNRDIFRSIVAKAPNKMHKVYSALSPAKKEIADKMLDYPFNMDLTNWKIPGSLF